MKKQGYFTNSGYVIVDADLPEVKEGDCVYNFHHNHLQIVANPGHAMMMNASNKISKDDNSDIQHYPRVLGIYATFTAGQNPETLAKIIDLRSSTPI